VLGAAQGLLVLSAYADRRAPHRRRVRGMSLIEIAIGLVILGIMVTLGLPSWNLFLENRKIRAAAEVLVVMLQEARVEAVKTNASVEFVTFNDDINLDDFSFIQTVTPEAGAKNWAIRRLNPVTLQYELVTARSGSEAMGQAHGSTPGVSVTGSVPKVTFNGFGATSGLAGTATFQIVRSNPNSNPDFKCAADNGAMRCLNVTVSTGGQVRMCDPKVSDVSDTRKC
jgi:type IV fimbrial biogenesis protein FimT